MQRFMPHASCWLVWLGSAHAAALSAVAAAVCRQPTAEFLTPSWPAPQVIGLRGTPNIGSLADWGVKYRKLDLAPSGSIDWEALATAVTPGAGFIAG